MLRLIFLAALAGFSRASDVLDYGDDDFESKIGTHDLALVEFFAPWCGHCKRLAPEYETAATRLKGSVPLVKVDCTSNSNTCSKYGVSGYPTLKIFRDGEDSGPYDGPRTADGIVSFLKKQAGPASVELKDDAAFQKFIADQDASVIGFFADDKSTSQAEYLKAASALRDNYRFAHTNSEALLQSQGIDGESQSDSDVDWEPQSRTLRRQTPSPAEGGRQMRQRSSASTSATSPAASFTAPSGSGEAAASTPTAGRPVLPDVPGGGAEEEDPPEHIAPTRRNNSGMMWGMTTLSLLKLPSCR